MRFLIVANWKCNPTTLKEARRLFNSVKRGLKKIKNVEVVICPSFVYLSCFKSFKNLKLGAQDCFWEEKGAFTGEISPVMLKDLGCQYVIIGHSERRTNFGETDEMINKKIKAALIAKLNPIFCIGEIKEEREKGQIQNILKSQIEKGLNGILKREIKNIVIAYEPVWAIGTGNPCDIEEAQKMALLIRKLISQKYSPAIAKDLRIIYGGSVDSQNARDYIKEAGMAGLLVGGASLNHREFLKILKEVARP